MFQQFLSSWWAMTSAFVTMPLSLLSGSVTLPALLGGAGLLLFTLGLVLALVQREKKALWLLLPFVLALASPVVLGLARGILGWMGVIFSLLVGAVMLLLWVGLIANDARHRAPIWLIGLSLLSYMAFCGYIGVAIIWSGG